MMTQQNEPEQKFGDCSVCPLNKTCIVYITGIKTIQSMKAQMVDELEILNDVSWKPEDLAKDCKHRPKIMEWDV